MSRSEADIRLQYADTIASCPVRGLHGLSTVGAAILHDDDDALRILIQSGADPSNSAFVEGESQMEALSYGTCHVACHTGSVNCLIACLELGANTGPAHRGRSLACIAAAQGHASCLKVLVEQNMDVHTADDEGETPAHLAALYGHSEALHILAAADVNLNDPTPKGRLPVVTAASQGHEDALRVIHQHGGVMDKEEEGRTAVHDAAANGHAGCLRFLLTDCGCDASIVNSRGLTPLWIAGQYFLLSQHSTLCGCLTDTFDHHFCSTSW